MKTYAYDANGNLISESSSAGVTTYSWDAENRLIGINKPDGSQVSYSYDGQGRRVSKSVFANNQQLTTNNYSYDNSWRVTKEVSSEQGGENREIQYNYYNEDTPISITYAGQTYFYLTNGHGDITGLSDSSGTIVARYSYDTWGRPIDTWTDDTTIAAELLNLNPYQYASYRFDTETGFYYLRNRYYDPRTSRFLSKDPIEAELTQPLTQNPYIYCENNPVNKIDSSGLRMVADGGGKIFRRPKPRTGRLPNRTKYWAKQFKKNARAAKQNQGEYFWFANKVTGPWNYKAKLKGRRFKFLGQVISGEDLGNIHYGYTGRALGVRKERLLFFSGAFQAWSDKPWIQVSHWATCFEEQRDQVMVEFGANLYDNPGILKRY